MKNQLDIVAEAGVSNGAKRQVCEEPSLRLDARAALRRSLVSALLFLGLAVCPLERASAIPACRDGVDVVQPGGQAIRLFLRGDEFLHWTEDAAGYTVLFDDARKAWVYARRDAAGQLMKSTAVVGAVDPVTLGLPKRLLSATAVREAKEASASRFELRTLNSDRPRNAPLTGVMKNLVLLVGFSDRPFTRTAAEYHDLLNKEGYSDDGAQGSLKDYYKEVSYNLLDVESIVMKPVTLSHGYAYYGTNTVSGSDARPQEMVAEALSALEAGGFDFSTVDSDKDGWIDGLTVIHAGGGEENIGNDPNEIWAHQGYLDSLLTYDGIKIRYYHTEAERRGADSAPHTWGITRVGIICHESGHYLGLPDLYDREIDSKGAGNFCLMAYGAWNGDYGSQPAQLSAVCKMSLGWLTPTPVTQSGTYSLPRVEDNPAAYRLGWGFPSTQYFLIENRQGHGSDASLPGSARGLLVWHVDETCDDNDDQTHYLVDLEEASGVQELELNSDAGDDGDYFREGTLTSFNGGTTPNNLGYAGELLGQEITAVSASADTMTFTVAQQASVQFKVESNTVSEAGSSVRVVVSRSGGSVGAVSVHYATADGTALAGSDYTAQAGTLTWSDGDAADKSFDVPLLDDSVIESDETFGVELSAVRGCILGTPRTMEVTISDMESGTLQFSFWYVGVWEDVSSIEFRVRRTGGSTGAASVNCGTAGGTATAGVDFESATNTLYWADGDMADKTFSVNICWDGIQESSETFNVVLSGASGAQLGTNSVRTVTISDWEEGRVQFASTALTVLETNLSARVGVTRSTGWSGEAWVNVSTKDGTASAGSDYTALAESIHWNNGEYGTKYVTVPLLDDAEEEGIQTFFLCLQDEQYSHSDGTNHYFAGEARTPVLVTINDVEPGTVQFRSPAYTVAENGSSVCLYVSRLGGSTGAASVTYTTANGTAAAGSDYLAQSGTLTWTDGGASVDKSIVITNVNDFVAEDSETLTVSLSGAAGTVLGPIATTTVTIEGPNDPEASLGEALDNTNLVWTTGGDSSWAGQLVTKYDGVDAALSGVIGDGQTNWVQTTVVGPGALSFWWNTSSETNCDRLVFYFNGSETASRSGTNVLWQKLAYALPAGTHTLRWAYAKNGSDSVGLDCGWLDQVTWTNTAFLISPAAQALPCAGGESEIGVSANASWEWSVACTSAWVTVTSASGTGTGTVSYTVATNWSTSARTATIYVRGVGTERACTVTQAASTFAISSAAQSLPCAAGASNLSVTADAAWAWSATCTSAWVTVTAPSGTGNGTVSYSVATNASLCARTATLYVRGAGGAERACTITQAGMPLTFSAVLNNANLAWSTGGHSSWFGQTLTNHDGVAAAQSGALANSQTNWIQTTVTGPGVISFWWRVDCEDIQYNNNDILRFQVDGVAHGRIDGHTGWLFVKMPLAAGSHDLRWSYSKNVSYTAPSDCGWLDQVTWFEVTPDVQAAVTGGSYSVDVTSDSAWGATGGADWITLNTAGGNGNGTVSFAVASSVSAAARTAEVTVTNGLDTLTFAVTQAGLASSVALSNALDCAALSWTGTNWLGQSLTSHDGADAAQSGAAAGGNALESEVTGPGTLSYWWKVACEDGVSNDCDYLSFSIDGVEQGRIDGQTGWLFVTRTLGTGRHSLNWTYHTNGTVSVYPDCGWVDQVRWFAISTDAQPAAQPGAEYGLGVTADSSWKAAADQAWVTLNTAAGSGDGTVSYSVAANAASSQRVAVLTVTNGVDTLTCTVTQACVTSSATLADALDNWNMPWYWSADWFGQSVTSHDGVDAAQCGAGGLGNRVESMVNGPGTLSFWWKAGCGDSVSNDGDYLAFWVDDVEQGRIDGQTGWLQVTLPLAAGGHYVRWEYRKNSAIPVYPDCGWIDQVSWVSSGTSATTVQGTPHEWLDQYGLVTGMDYEAADAADTDGDGFTAGQEYVAGSVPTNGDSTLRIFLSMPAGSPVLTWTPDLGAARVYTVQGKASLATASWLSPTNAASRFYRVKVDLP